MSPENKFPASPLSFYVIESKSLPDRLGKVKSQKSKVKSQKSKVKSQK
jgi:hypothetical protein